LSNQAIRKEKEKRKNNFEQFHNGLQ